MGANGTWQTQSDAISPLDFRLKELKIKALEFKLNKN